MSLSEYKRKRHFERSPEPVGKKAAKGGSSYVIQKHLASHLHYDFRLELDGVLKSWAVPKGPSLDPTVKRLAMEVEDHPVDYGSFEGVIPEGEYGGGTVMLWDRGEWAPLDDPREGWRTGRLKFELHGEKLHGRWMLVRTRSTGSGEKERHQWLLFKERDDEAKPAKDGDVLEELPLSVSTGRTLEEIATERDWVWGSRPKAGVKAKRQAASSRPSNGKARASKGDTSSVEGAKAQKIPTRVEVQLATLAKEAPDGDQWLHEMKLDGYRMICRLDQGRVEFISRNHKDWTARFPSLVEAVKKLPATQAIFDGEVVALRPDGTTDFQELQNAFRAQRAQALHYYAFDLLYLDGYDLTGASLEDRKGALAKLIEAGRAAPNIHLSEHIEGSGPDFLAQACKRGLEGIVSKRRDRPYRSGRGDGWLKVKCGQHDEFVIGGYSEPGGSRTGFGAILVGYHDAKGALVYAGKVGTGFAEPTLHALLKQFKPLEQESSPFVDFKSASRKTHWVEPKLVAQVAFGAWTREGLLRHAAFQGLREDKAAAEVTREKALPLSKVVPPEGRASSRRSAVNRGKKKQGEGDSRGAGSDDYDAKAQLLAGVRLTSPDKVLYPDVGVTKLELANYYRAVADWILPHLVDRPLVLVRCPEGREKECFYQKHPRVGTPDNLRQIMVRENKKTEPYVVVDDAAGLISLAQVGALEIHAWGARADDLEKPDRLIFDLDPDTRVPWSRVVDSARQLREFLQEIGLESFVKTTGGKGLHLVIPIARRHDWEEVKAFCKQVADLIVAADPRHYTANMAKAARPGKIFIDYLRNGRGATAIVPYSTRARAGAPVSVPLTWKELSGSTPSDHFTVRNIAKRLSSLKRDPWEGIASVRQGLSSAIKKVRFLGH